MTQNFFEVISTYIFIRIISFIIISVCAYVSDCYFIKEINYVLGIVSVIIGTYITYKHICERPTFYFYTRMHIFLNIHSIASVIILLFTCFYLMNPGIFATFKNNIIMILLL
jgi:hypothetical protein